MDRISRGEFLSRIIVGLFGIKVFDKILLRPVYKYRTYDLGFTVTRKMIEDDIYGIKTNERKEINTSS